MGNKLRAIGVSFSKQHGYKWRLLKNQAVIIKETTQINSNFTTNFQLIEDSVTVKTIDNSNSLFIKDILIAYA